MLMALSAFADSGVLLKLAGGSTVGFAFAEKPVIATGDSLVMRTSTGTVAYAYNEISRIEFGNVPMTPNAVSTPTEETKSCVNFRITGTGIDVAGLRRGERVAVYTINGTKVAGASASAGNSTVSLQLPQAGGNIFIVRTSTGVTFKFIRK